MNYLIQILMIHINNHEDTFCLSTVDAQECYSESAYYAWHSFLSEKFILIKDFINCSFIVVFLYLFFSFNFLYITPFYIIIKFTCSTVLSVGHKIEQLYCPLRGLDTSLPLKMGCSGYDTKLHQVVRLQFLRSGKCGVPLNCH